MSLTPPPARLSAAAPRPLGQLESEICTLAGHLAAASCRFLVLLAEFDVREGWASWDMPSCAAWLSWKCQLSSGTAREHVRVARALTVLPVIRGEFAAGRFSYAKVRALTRIATPDSDADLAEMAGPMTANQLDRFARAHRTVTQNMSEQAQLGRRLRWRFEDDGSLSLSARLPPEDGAAVLTALRAVVREIAASPSSLLVSLCRLHARRRPIPLLRRNELASLSRAAARKMLCLFTSILSMPIRRTPTCC